MLENKLRITSSVELANEEEKITIYRYEKLSDIVLEEFSIDNN